MSTVRPRTVLQRVRPALESANRGRHRVEGTVSLAVRDLRFRIIPATARRLHTSPIVLGALLGAILSFSVCFVVVANATRSSAPDRTAERAASGDTSAKLALGPAAALRVKPDVLAAPVVQAPVTKAPVTPATTPQTLTQTQQQQVQTTQTAPVTPVQQTPAPKATPTPKPKATPKPKPKPSKPTGPDFDDSGPGGSG